jgi:hypothetical protein
MHVQRLAHNQILFREVNERIRDVVEARDGSTEFVCECSREDCRDTIELDLAMYEGVRAHPNRFLVKPGHEMLEIEQVAEKNRAFLLIEKIVEADYAVKHGPRARDENLRSKVVDQ